MDSIKFEVVIPIEHSCAAIINKEETVEYIRSGLSIIISNGCTDSLIRPGSGILPIVASNTVKVIEPEIPNGAAELQSLSNLHSEMKLRNVEHNVKAMLKSLQAEAEVWREYEKKGEANASVFCDRQADTMHAVLELIALVKLLKGRLKVAMTPQVLDQREDKDPAPECP